MDWTTVGSVLGSNFFVAAVSLATVKWQIKGAERQLKSQIQNERERDHTERRREIRSEPLMKFEGELAHMAAKYEQLVLAARQLHTKVGLTDEEAANIFKQRRDALNEYFFKGSLFRNLTYT